MPLGLVLFSWDSKFGINVEVEYPINISKGLDKDDILTVFASSALSGDAGIYSLKIKQINVVSYYSGKPKNENEM